MSGAGKSSALNALGARGYRVVDTDYGEWIEDVPGRERVWREEEMEALLRAHEQSGEPLIVAGTVRNQGRFYPRFDHVVLLTAPLPVLLDRVARRTDNGFGKGDGERARIAADTAEVEPLLRASASVVIDTREPLSAVVERLAALAGPPPHP
ncbi:shikimate kinase [Actinokineospora bangkokensis]|uniref:Shikimate kinase n=2 Tax=Actinokineospora bangkokensis TaxID=1193682 RepID=A0A1Q9LMX2_9PSEU|nr:shikimate kinase [Actinokineospora bangkokensis]